MRPPLPLLGLLLVSSPALAAEPGVTLSNDNVIIQALRARSAVPCAALADQPDLAAELYAIAEADVAPAWVSLRAASCLAERFSADERFVAWVTPWFTDDERGGLGMAALTTALADPTTRGLLEPLARQAPERWRDLYTRRLDAADATP